MSLFPRQIPFMQNFNMDTQNAKLDCAYTGVNSFIEIDLSHSILKTNLKLTSKNGRKKVFGKTWHVTMQIPWVSKIL